MSVCLPSHLCLLGMYNCSWCIFTERDILHFFLHKRAHWDCTTATKHFGSTTGFSPLTAILRWMKYLCFWWSSLQYQQWLKLYTLQMVEQLKEEQVLFTWSQYEYLCFWWSSLQYQQWLKLCTQQMVEQLKQEKVLLTWSQYEIIIYEYIYIHFHLEICIF